MKRFLVSFAVVVLFGSVSAVAGAGTGGSSGPPVVGLEQVSRGQAQSLNWSGYAVYGDTFKTAQGSWEQPGGTCAKKNYQLAAFFVGIDGYNSNTVEQIGTDVDCVQGQAVHYAWYEMYPAPPVNLATNLYPVAPGDTLTATVSYASGQFTLRLDNDCHCGSWPFTTTQTASGSEERTSAEWIAEAPATGGHFWPLTNFGSVTFTSASVTNDGSHTGSISDGTWSNDEITMVKQGRPFNPTVKAQPGDLQRGGTAFTVDWLTG